MKKLLAVLTLLLVCRFLPAFDMGFNIDNATAYFNSGDQTLVQGDTGTLWLRFDSDEAGRFDISGTYDFLVTMILTSANPSNAPIEPYRFDVGITRWTKTFGLDKSNLSFDLGRHTVTDLTGWIYNSKMDGVRVTWVNADLALWLGVDYTGLVRLKNSNVMVSSDDLTALKQNAQLASSRLVTSAGIMLPELFLRQDLSLELSGQFDLNNNALDPIGNGELAFQFAGPIAPGWREKLYGVAQLVSEKSVLGFGFILGGAISYNVPIPGGNLTLNGVYSSGHNGTWGDFQTVAGKSSLVTSQLPLGKIAELGLDFSFDPVSKLTTGIKLASYFRTTTLSLGLSGFNNNTTGVFLGIEPNLYGTVDISSEFSLNLSAALFVPNAGSGNDATFTASTVPNLLIAMTFSLKI